MNINRRTLVRGSAWTVPVIATAAVVPAFATSIPACKPRYCKTRKKGSNNKYVYRVWPNCTAVPNGKLNVTVDGVAAVWNGTYYETAGMDHDYTRTLTIKYNGQTLFNLVNATWGLC